MEKENLYEVTELQQYDVNSGYEFKDDKKSKGQVLVAKGKVFWALIVVIVVVLITLFLILALLLALFVDGYNMSSTSTTTGQSVGGMDCPSTSLPNCSIVYDEWTNRMQEEMNELKQTAHNLQNQSSTLQSQFSALQTQFSTLLTRFSTLVNVSEDTVWKIDDIRNFADMQTEKGINNSMDINKILETTGNSASKLINIVNTLSNLQDTGTSTAGVADDILLIAQELLVLHNDSTALPTSCIEVKERQPNSPSGVYQLAPAAIGGSIYTAYCNMGTLCGSGGGWTRLAYLDMTDSTQNCPSGFKLYQSGGVRACGQPVLGSGCSASVQFPSNGISYSQVCGRVTGYLFGDIDAVNTAVVTDSDGVTISRGPSQQQIWTLMGGRSESSSSSSSCPCNTGSSVSVPASIGNNYFCESGTSASIPTNILYTSDPLWDGQGCGSLEGPCCNVPGIPWFHRDYGSTTTTDYIELRVCGDGSDEDSPVSFYEIYVK